MGAIFLDDAMFLDDYIQKDSSQIHEKDMAYKTGKRLGEDLSLKGEEKKFIIGSFLN